MQKRLRAVEQLKGPVVRAGELRRALASTAPEPGVEELLSTCEKPPFTADVAWSNSGSDGRCDVLFERNQKHEWELPVPPGTSDKPLRSCANNPLQAKLAHDLVPELRAFLQAKLPDYMVPAAFVLLEKLPLTPNGKIDRRALPIPDMTQVIRDESYVAPSTPAEAAVAQIWREVLHLPQVGVKENFFELGGHSLHVTQVVARIRDAFQVDLPVRQLFEQPTVAATAAAIEGLLVEDIRQLSEDDARQLVSSAS
jgi:acyl carrier protein